MSRLARHRHTIGFAASLAIVSALALAPVVAQGEAPTLAPVRIDFTSRGAVQQAFVQRDGRIVARGHFNLVNGVLVAGFARLLPDGAFDHDWQPPSIVFRDQAPTELQFAEAHDGALLVCGAFVTVNGAARRGLARLLPDGTLDDGWDPAATLGADARCTGIQSIGHTAVVGIARTGVSTLMRFDDRFGFGYPGFAYDRPLPESFVGNGVDALYTIHPGGPMGLVVQKVSAVTGATDPQWSLRGLEHPGGIAIDASNGALYYYGLTAGAFGSPQVVKVSQSSPPVRDMGWQPDVSGFRSLESGATSRGALFLRACDRYSNWCPTVKIPGTSPARIDPAYLGPYGHRHPNPLPLQVQPDGGVVESPGLWVSDDPGSGLRRRRFDGSDDATFGADVRKASGILTMAAARDGSLVMAGRFSRAADVPTASLARLDAASNVDRAWLASRWLANSGYTSEFITALAVDERRTPFVATLASDDTGNSAARITKHPADGSEDEAWPMIELREGRIHALLVDADSGWLYLAGDFDGMVCGERRRHLARVSIEGPCRADPTWAPAVPDPVGAASFDARGGLLVGTVPASPMLRPAAHRYLLEDGTADPAFVPPRFSTDNGGVGGILATAGGIFIAGDFDALDGHAIGGLARLADDGRHDPTFAPDRALSTNAIAFGSDGALYAARTYAGSSTPVHRLERFVTASGGSVDGVVAADGRINALVPLRDGRLAAGGDFTMLAGQRRINFAVLQPPPLFADGFE